MPNRELFLHLFGESVLRYHWLEIVDTGNSRAGRDAAALLFSVFDSLRSRFLLAVGVAVAAALVITALFSGATRQAEKRGSDAEAIWKTRTGVDLAALPRLHPAHDDSEEARRSTSCSSRLTCI